MAQHPGKGYRDSTLPPMTFMNDEDRQELARLKVRKLHLEADLNLFSMQLGRLEERISKREAGAAISPAAGERPSLRVQLPQPTVDPETRVPTGRLIPTPPPLPSAIEPPLLAPAVETSVLAPEAADPVQQPEKVSYPTAIRVQAPESASSTAGTFFERAVPPPAKAPEEVRSLEMRVGTYWLVRIGVVMVLTGLVFFGNLAYQNYISKLGPGGKVSLLYLASLALLGAGWWWQRKAAKESLRNYAQVLFAVKTGGATPVWVM